MMKMGDFDRRISLRHRVLTANALGEQVESWPTSYATVWARKQDAQLSRRGEKIQFADQTTQLQLTQFDIRYRTDVDASDRVVDDRGRSYEIVQFLDIGRRDFTGLLCKAVLT